MASSQTSHSQKKRDQIIDGRLFSRTTVLNRLKSEVEDTDNMEIIISKIKEQGLHHLGSTHTSYYDEELVEDFYQDASVKLYSHKHGGGVRDIRATVQGVRICIDNSFLESTYGMPSSGMLIEELESFGSKEQLTAYWRLFTGNSSNTDIHMSCPKKNLCLPFVYLHDFCCRIIENRTGAFTNLRFKMMVAILYGEKVNWCQFVLNRLGEEVVKPLSQKKSFGLFINNLLFNCGVTLSHNAKKIGPGIYIGGSKPTAYCHAGLFANRPFISMMPNSQHPRRSLGRTSAAEDLSKKIKRSVSNSMSPHTEEKKQKKAFKSKSKGTVTDPVTVYDQPSVQSADLSSQGATLAKASPDPLPTATMSDQHIFAGLENLDESTTQIKSMITSPEWAPIPEQDPTHYRVVSPVCDPFLNRNPSPVRDPSPIRVPTPVRDPSPIQASIPVEDPIPTETPVPVRSPSPSPKPFNPQVEQAFQRFTKWKSYRTAPYKILFYWKEWKEEEQFIMEITEVRDVQPLIQWVDQYCHELIYSHFITLDAARRKEKGNSAVPDQMASDVVPQEPQPNKAITGPLQEEVIPPVQHPNALVSTAPSEASQAIPQEESIPLSEQATAERQKEVETTPVPLSTEAPEAPTLGASSANAPNYVICTESQEEARTEHLEDLDRQTVFLQDAVYALYQVGKEMDWLNLLAKEESASIQSELSNITKSFKEFPEDMKNIIAELQKQQEQILLEEQSRLRVCESKTVVALDFSDSRIADHDKKIKEMSLFINSLVEKPSKFEEQQENILKVLQSIDHNVSEINVKKGEVVQDETRESAPMRPSDRDSSRSQSSRHEHQHRRR
ncbi:hypothetical protein OROHE_000603 [Orobanche hederae]